MIEAEKSENSNLQVFLPGNNRLKSVAFYSTGIDDAMAVVRMTGPAKAAGIEVLQGSRKLELIENNAIVKSDIVVFQREFSQDYEIYEKIVNIAHSNQKPVVLDLDDLLLELPENHPDREKGYFTDALLPMLQAVMDADLVTVASEPLLEYLLPYNDNVRVIPNYFDDSLWHLRPYSGRKKADDPVIIGYMGSHSHEPDLKMILPTLLEMMHRYPDRIRFCFWGIQPPSELLPFSNVGWFPPPTNRYVDFAEYFQTQAADIVIAPLCDNLFNSCKSAIKFFEYSAIGVPGVYSGIAPYTSIIDDGKDGLLASTTSEWVDAISRIIESPEIGADMVENAQKKIRDHWLLSAHAGTQFEIYEEIISRHKNVRKVFPPFYSLVRSLAGQYNEKKQRDEIMLQSMKKQTTEMETQLKIIQNKLSAELEESRGKLVETQDAMARLEEESNMRLTETQDAMARLEEESNMRLTETQDAMAQLEEESRIRLTEAQNEMVQLEDEVLKYALSRSWRWTRPLRQILSKLHR